jgi:hypothetical protein
LWHSLSVRVSEAFPVYVLLSIGALWLRFQFGSLRRDPLSNSIAVSVRTTWTRLKCDVSHSFTPTSYRAVARIVSSL